jgi:hypothetical protein
LPGFGDEVTALAVLQLTWRRYLAGTEECRRDPSRVAGPGEYLPLTLPPPRRREPNRTPVKN